MKKTIFSLLFFMVVAAAMNHAVAQESTDIRNTIVYRIQKGIYNRALKYNDVPVATNALYNLCIMESQNDSLLFALGYMYFDNQKYLSAALTLTDVLMLNSGNVSALEMKALSLEQIGAKDKALEDYETLYLKTNNINFLYKMAVFQYDLQRLKEAKTNIDIMLTNKEADSIKYYFPNKENEQQEVVMRASLHNLKGMVAKSEGNNEEAKKQFAIALEIDPEFFIARNNLEELQK